MDGVIVDSEPLHFRAAQQIIKKYGKKLPKERSFQLIGVGEDFFWKTVVKELGISFDYKQLLQEKSELYMKLLQNEGNAFPGVVELIKKLSKNYKLAIASGSSLNEITIILQKLLIRPYFIRVVSGDDVAKSKPHPEIYLNAAKNLGVVPSECVVIEDSINGVKAAKAAGMGCVAVTNSFPRKMLGEADYVIDSLNEFDLDYFMGGK